MKLRSVLSIVALQAAVVLAGGVLGCGPGTPSGKTASVQAGSMPSDASWSGVYYSQLYGYLHMVQEGNLVNGKWLRPVKGDWGKLQGNADGNLLRFDWEEYDIGRVGPRSTKKGKGYFVYKRPEGDNVDDEIVGEIGKGLDEVGNPWDAVKQRNQKPDLDSIGGTGATDVGGGDWDSQNKEKGEPEEPAEPDEAEDKVEKPEL